MSKRNINEENSKFNKVPRNSTVVNLIDNYKKTSLYFLSETTSNNDDYKLISKCFEELPILDENVEIHRIYCVEKRKADKTTEQKSNNLLSWYNP